MAKKWIQKAIKHKGALKKQLGVKKVTMTKLNQVSSRLRKKAEKSKLSPSERKLLRRVNLAKTLMKLRKKGGKA
jgi:hypothetical protein